MRNAWTRVIEIVRIWGCLLRRDGHLTNPRVEHPLMRNAFDTVDPNPSHLGMLSPQGWTSHQPRSGASPDAERLGHR